MQPDSVDPPRGDPPPAPPRKRFDEVLRARTGRPTSKPAGPPRTPRRSSPTRAPRAATGATRAPAELRSLARREMDASARRRLEDGRTASAGATGRLAERTTDLLRAALRTEKTARAEHAARVTPASDGPVASPSPAPPGAPGGLPTAAVPLAATGAALPAAEGRIERALALVERIERFVRSGRPSLALTLRGGIPGRLEVERVGPGAVSLRLSTPRAPSASELGDLRQALEARGLSVRSLEARRLGSEICGSASVLTASAGDACSPCP